MKIMRLIFALLALLTLHDANAIRHGRGLPLPTVSDPTINIIPSFNDTYTNWSNAGLLSLGGIPTRSTQCGSTLNPSGSDDSSAINSAITSCTAGDYVLLGAGTSSSITASISGTTLTVTSGSGEAIGNVIGDANGQVAPGTKITAGSGSSWTVSISQTVGSESMRAVVPFLISQSEYVALNKAVSLRGTGSCTNAFSPFCSTVILVNDGAIPDWSISGSTTGANCGVTSSSTSGCSAATGVILMSPSGNYNWGWAGCFLGVNATTGNCGTTLTADAAAGATTVSVTSTANFSVGMWVLIDESPQVTSTTNPTGGTALEASSEFTNSGLAGAGQVMLLEGGDIPGAYSFIGSGGGSQENQRLNQEIHQIASIGSGTLTFSDPLTLAFRQSGSHDARVYWPTVQGSTANPFLQQAGVENLTILKAAAGGVQMQFCAYCWVKNVEVAGWIAGAVNFNYTARSQAEFNYFHDCFDCENNGTEYPVGISQAATETYVVNNIIVRGGKCMVGRGANTAVVGYNYGDDTFYMAASIGDYWMDMCGNGSHYAGTHHFLFEGNSFDNCDADETHGNAIYHVYIRNQCTGIRTTFTDPSNGKTVSDSTGSCWGNGSVSATCGPLRAAGPMAFDYRLAFVGNVLGLSGVTTTGNGWVYKGAFCGGGTCSGGFAQNKAIWMSGWVGGEEPSTDPNLTTGTNPWIFRNCNYDYVNGSVADCAGGSYSSTIPNSFYLSSVPAFFSTGTCTYPWPWVTPAGGSQIQTNSCSGFGLPARARFAAGTPFVQP